MIPANLSCERDKSSSDVCLSFKVQDELTYIVCEKDGGILVVPVCSARHMPWREVDVIELREFSMKHTLLNVIIDSHIIIITTCRFTTTQLTLDN
jgi:hypothetical protein